MVEKNKKTHFVYVLIDNNLRKINFYKTMSLENNLIIFYTKKNTMLLLNYFSLKTNKKRLSRTYRTKNNSIKNLNQNFKV